MVTENTIINLGLVPEHFSSPIYMSQTEGGKNPFLSQGLSLNVVNCPAGTGEMIKKLMHHELDIAFLVTEGYVSAKLKGNTDIVAIGTYVESPLCWAVSTGSKREFTTLEDLPNPPTFGISRMGSGSHVMSQYMATELDWDINKLGLEVHNNLSGLAEGVISGASDIFLWEHFTTKPLYDNGMLKKIGEVVAPWPSFLIVANKRVLQESPLVLQAFLESIQLATQNFVNNPKESKAFIQSKFQYPIEDIEEWFRGVRYPADVTEVSRDDLKTCTEALSCPYPDMSQWIDTRLAKWV